MSIENLEWSLKKTNVAWKPWDRRELPMSVLRKRLLSNSRFKQTRYRLEYWGMMGLANLIPNLSRPQTLRLSSAVGWTIKQLDRRGRNLACENLRFAVRTGRLDLSEGDIESTVSVCYRNFAQNFIELFWHSHLSRENLTEWVDFEGAEVFDELRDSGRGGILVTPHFGSFEWSSLIIGLLGIRLNIVMRSFRNPLVESVFTTARQANGHQLCDHERVVLRLIRALNRGTSVAMLADLAVPPQRASAPIDMFGKATSLSTLPAELAIRCSVPIIAAICEPLAQGRVKLKVVRVINPRSDENVSPNAAKLYTQTIWDAFEKEIRRRPDCWLWMYKHWRFSVEANEQMDPDAGTETNTVTLQSGLVNGSEVRLVA